MNKYSKIEVSQNCRGWELNFYDGNGCFVFTLIFHEREDYHNYLVALTLSSNE